MFLCCLIMQDGMGDVAGGDSGLSGAGIVGNANIFPADKPDTRKR